MSAQFRRSRRQNLFFVISAVVFSLLLALLAAACLISPFGLRSWRHVKQPLSSARMKHLPRVFLWAWERPENLTFVDPHETGIAYLAETIYISNHSSYTKSVSDDFVIRPRMQPLRVPDGTALMAVARIEMRGTLQRNGSGEEIAITPEIDAQIQTQSDGRVERVATAIARLAEVPSVSAVQVDFDATVSQRAFYSAMLHELRHRLPANMPLSITALASWCYGDTWLDSLPIDEAVPMLFRMGVDDRNIRSMLVQGKDFRSPVCRGSLGFSTDEDAQAISPGIFSGRRIYWFHPRTWTAAAFHDAVQGVRP